MRRRDFLMTAAVASLLPQTSARGQDAFGSKEISPLWCRLWREDRLI